MANNLWQKVKSFVKHYWERVNFKKLKFSIPEKIRGRIIVGILIVTNIYLYLGLIFAWNIYVAGKTGPNLNKILAVYPLPAARVGSTVIPLSRYYRDLNAVSHYIEVTNTQSQYADVNLPKQIMERLIDAAIYSRLAHQYNITVTNAEVDQAFSASAAEEADPVEKVLSDYYNFTPADFKVWVREFLIQQKVNETLPMKRTIKQILIAVPADANDETVEAKKQQAADIQRQLKEGVNNFDDLAKKFSNDLTTRDNGGNLGTVTRGSNSNPVIDKAFEDAAFSIPLNTPSDPVRSSQGWHIILVTDQSGIVSKSMQQILNDEKQRAGISIYLNQPQS